MTTPHNVDIQTFDEALGFTVQQYLFAHGVTRVELGKLLHVPGPSVSNRLRGRIRWSAEDVAVVAARFGVGSGDLMPILDPNGRWVPASFNPAAAVSTKAAPASAGAALEPPERIELSTYSLLGPVKPSIHLLIRRLVGELFFFAGAEFSPFSKQEERKVREWKSLSSQQRHLLTSGRSL